MQTWIMFIASPTHSTYVHVPPLHNSNFITGLLWQWGLCCVSNFSPEGFLESGFKSWALVPTILSQWRTEWTSTELVWVATFKSLLRWSLITLQKANPSPLQTRTTCLTFIWAGTTWLQLRQHSNPGQKETSSHCKLQTTQPPVSTAYRTNLCTTLLLRTSLCLILRHFEETSPSLSRYGIQTHVIHTIHDIVDVLSDSKEGHLPRYACTRI